ncbi:MAG: hypothetical protein CBB68_15140 [Rhodospirillaceae bacterium TMED8]|nr:zinc-finger domain-containing protein [Magnetovibrio sp.]OUT47763.1 MAG: hypothetical protein CBB68_15140 [Rhodospirillaceae bacterium TMED8]|tara:strand:+ start:370 stop:549 length:180 start_codon:yes stop_codon:yes gene_type:complete
MSSIVEPLASETIYVTSRKVICDGGSDISGHPRIYLEMGRKDEIMCPYCSRHYVMVKEA